MLALICGQGTLPGLIFRNISHVPVIAALDQFRPEGLAVDLTFRLETLGTFLNELKAPRSLSGFVSPARLGAQRSILRKLMRLQSRFVSQIVGALAGGDDAALRVVIDIFEQAGFEVVGFCSART